MRVRHARHVHAVGGPETVPPVIEQSREHPLIHLLLFGRGEGVLSQNMRYGGCWGLKENDRDDTRNWGKGLTTQQGLEWIVGMIYARMPVRRRPWA